MRRHAFVGDNLDKVRIAFAVGSDDFSRFALDDHFAAVQMIDFPSKSTEGFFQGQRFGDEQIGAFALEQFVRLFLHNKVDVARFHVGHFVGHAAEDDLLVVPHPLLDQHVQHLAILPPFAPVPFSLAIGAVTLDLLDHAQTDLAQFQDNPIAVAGWTTAGLALQHVPTHGEFDRFAGIQFFKRRCHGVVDVIAPLWPTAAHSTAKEHTEQILGRPTTAASPSSLVDQSLQTILIVFGSLFWITQYLVRGVDLFEGVFVPALVGMMLDGQFAIRGFDFFGSGRLGNLRERKE